MDKTYVNVNPVASKHIAALASRRAAYSDAVRVSLPEYTLLFVSGVTVQKDGVIKTRDMRGQARQALLNLKEVIEHEGGTLSDVVRFRMYVSEIDSASIRDVHDARLEFFSTNELPAGTLVRIDGYVSDGAKIEIEADVVMQPKMFR
jgi:enamine deaminase RidA (YjgF/YER057c/UK114 family)